MKTLFLALILSLSTTAFAQDGYHLVAEENCGVNESCLKDMKSDWILKLITFTNDLGEVEWTKLSNESFLADVVHQNAEVCFQGNIKEVCDVLEVSSNVDGGDAVIHKFTCAEKNKTINLYYQVEYYGYGTEDNNFTIKKCE